MSGIDENQVDQDNDDKSNTPGESSEGESNKILVNGQELMLQPSLPPFLLRQRRVQAILTQCNTEM